MTRFYANENFPQQTVRELRRLGHDVLTSIEAGNANRSVPDEEVLAFATLVQFAIWEVCGSEPEARRARIPLS